MATKVMKVRLRQIVKSTDEWSRLNPILMKGEIGVNSDLNTYKIGDGETSYLDLPVTSYMLNNDGSTIIDGGLEELRDGRIPSTIVLRNESSDSYSQDYIPKKGEPVAYKTSYHQGVKVGDGMRSMEHLPYVTPSDDIFVQDAGDVEDFRI